MGEPMFCGAFKKKKVDGIIVQHPVDEAPPSAHPDNGVEYKYKTPEPVQWTICRHPPEFPTRSPDVQDARLTPFPTPVIEPVRVDGIAVKDALQQRHLEKGYYILGGAHSIASQQVACYLKYLGLDEAGTQQFRSVPVESEDTRTDWFGVLSAGRRQHPVLIMDGNVYT